MIQESLKFSWVGRALLLVFHNGVEIISEEGLLIFFTHIVHKITTTYAYRNLHTCNSDCLSQLFVPLASFNFGFHKEMAVLTNVLSNKFPSEHFCLKEFKSSLICTGRKNIGCHECMICELLFFFNFLTIIARIFHKWFA